MFFLKSAWGQGDNVNVSAPPDTSRLPVPFKFTWDPLSQHAFLGHMLVPKKLRPMIHGDFMAS